MKDKKIVDFFLSNPDVSLYDIIRVVIKENGIVGVGLVTLEQHIHNAIWYGDDNPLDIKDIMPHFNKITDGFAKYCLKRINQVGTDKYKYNSWDWAYDINVEFTLDQLHKHYDEYLKLQEGK